MQFPQVDVVRIAGRVAKGTIKVMDGVRDLPRQFTENLLVYATIGRYLAHRDPEHARRLYDEAISVDDYELNQLRRRYVGATVKFSPNSQYGYIRQTGRVRRVTRVPGTDEIAFGIEGHHALVAEVELVERSAA